MIVAGGLWLGERIFRLLRMARTNKFGTVKAKVPAIRPFPPVPMRSKQPVEGYRFSNLSDTTLTAPKQHSSGGQALTYRELPDVQTDRLTSPSTAILMSDCTSHKYGQSQFSSTDFDSGSVMTRPLLEPPPPIPAGYAQAQLLPSDTIRLTIKVAKPFIWSPGQSLSLCLPDLAPFQSHPFTIVNNDPSGIMLLIKARKGLTRKLYNWVWKHRQRYLEQNGLHQNRQPIGSTPSGESVLQVPPVHLRAIIDGPFGSSSRVTWGDYSTVVIFCGGSGVSFGGSILEYICGQLSQIGTSTSPRFKTRRLRFCWVVREYAEIAWIASHLRRCHLMVLPEQVQIEIFVTRKPTSISRTDELRRPRLSRTRSDSAITEMTDDETATYINEEHHITPFPLVSPTGSAPTTYLDPFDLTNYDDEADVEDLEQLRLSSQIEQEGKLRRAQSRQAARSPLPQILKAGPLASPPQRKRTPVPSPDAREHLLPPDLRLMPPPLGTPRPESRLSPLPSAPEPSYDPFDDDHGLRSPRSDTLSLPKASRAGSSVTPSIFGDDVEFSADTTSGRDMQLLSRATRTRGVVALDTAERDLTGVETAKTLWLDEADFAAMSVLSEVAHTGRPQLDALIEQELLTAEGDVIVASESAFSQSVLE